MEEKEGKEGMGCGEFRVSLVGKEGKGREGKGRKAR